MIIWLASYPKSGNTWIRLFLNTLLYTNNELNINNIKIEQFPNKKHYKNILNNFSDLEGVIKNSLNAQYSINLDNNIKFFKTHSSYWKSKIGNFTNNDNTLGVIYIVRDPRNVITSLKKHFGKKSYEDALAFMQDQRKFLGSKYFKNENDVPTLISSWSNNYKSWKKFKKNYFLIKYENLLTDSKKEFINLINFIKNISDLKFDKNQIEKVIYDCNFENLKKLENQKGFVEASKDSDQNFFSLGPDNNWKKILSADLCRKIENSFKDEMKELDYL
tara:strand:+ start:135 stop:959 length:825 start_codon:yes stop_codon:yes gene_type:complete